MIKILILVICSLLVGCSTESQGLSPEEIVDNAIEISKDESPYYMETSYITYSDEEEVSVEGSMKQWFNIVGEKQKVRVEIYDTYENSITTSDGERYIRYDEESNWAQISESDLADHKDSLLEITFKKQVESTLGLLKETHDVESLEEEEVNGIECYYLKLSSKKETEVIGEHEVWIDKDTWEVVKMINDYGNVGKTEMEVVKLDISPEIDDSLFTLDIPEDAEIVDLDEIIVQNEPITMEEATKKIEKQLLYVPESFGYELELNEQIIHKKDEDSDYKLMQSYLEDGESMFIIYLEEVKRDFSIEEFLDVVAEEEIDVEEIEIMGTKGLVDNQFGRIIFFSDGIRYELNTHGDEVSMEEAVEMVQNMTYYE